MRSCIACGRTVAHRLVFVSWSEDGQPAEESGPYGRACAQRAVQGLAQHGIAAKRRREYVE